MTNTTNNTKELTLEQLDKINGGDGFLEALRKIKDQMDKTDWKKILEELEND